MPPSTLKQQRRVPQLDLAPLTKNLVANQGLAPAYKVAEAGNKKAIAPISDTCHLYPSVDGAEERMTLMRISRLPRLQAVHMRTVYHNMVEARQKYEALAFRGQRVLCNVSGHWREQLSDAAHREEELRERLALAKATCGQQQQQLDSLSMLVQGLKGLITP